MSDSNLLQSIKVRDTISRMSFYDPPLENRNPEENLLMDFNEAPQENRRPQDIHERAFSGNELFYR